MSGNFVSNPCRLVGVHLDGTGEVPAFEARGFVQVIGIRAANRTGSDVAFTASWSDTSESEAYRIIHQHPVPANGAVWFPLEAFALDEGDEITVQAGTGGALDVIVSLTEVPGRVG